jgi:hypothetical protein
MRKYSYESMLRAVGRVLDEAEMAGVGLRAEADSLVVETADQAGNAGPTLTFRLSDLVELIELKSGKPENAEPHYERTYAHDEGTLETFLRQHELAEARR